VADGAASGGVGAVEDSSAWERHDDALAAGTLTGATSAMAVVR
jgi:hypothetical protein